jgi:hypothetical protein
MSAIGPCSSPLLPTIGQYIFRNVSILSNFYSLWEISSTYFNNMVSSLQEISHRLAKRLLWNRRVWNGKLQLQNANPNHNLWTWCILIIELYTGLLPWECFWHSVYIFVYICNFYIFSVQINGPIWRKKLQNMNWQLAS